MGVFPSPGIYLFIFLNFCFLFLLPECKIWVDWTSLSRFMHTYVCTLNKWLAFSTFSHSISSKFVARICTCSGLKSMHSEKGEKKKSSDLWSNIVNVKITSIEVPLHLATPVSQSQPGNTSNCPIHWCMIKFYVVLQNLKKYKKKMIKWHTKDFVVRAPWLWAIITALG